MCVLFHLAGVRYNAEKKRVGNYYTTPIYRFRMKCHLCDNHFEIETDPKVRIGILVEKSHLMLVFKKVREILTFLNTYMG